MLELMEHQKRGVEWLTERQNAALFDEPGLGKSAQLLLSAKEPVLITAPAMVLDSGTWDDEIEKWAPGIEATQVPYSSLMQRGPRGKIYRDSNGFATNPPKEEYSGRYGTKIADESHYIKGRKTSWTTAFMKILAEDTKLATGTPIPNWADEAFTSLQAIYPEESKAGRRFGAYWRWAKDWFMVGPTFWASMAVQYDEATMAIGPKPGVTWEEFYEGNWGDRMLLRLRADCLDLPPLTVQPWRVRMTPDQKRAYRELKEDFVTWLDSGVEIAAWSSAGQMVRLAKCATGLEVLDRSVKGSGKLDALRVLLTDRPRATLVVGHFRDTVEACARAAGEVDQEAEWIHGGTPRAARKEIIRAFQKGNLQVLCAGIDVIAEGMNLQESGADQCIRVERSMLPSKNDQVVRRLHRIGVQSPITCIDLVTEGSYDEAQLKMLADKTDNQMRALGIQQLRQLA